MIYLLRIEEEEKAIPINVGWALAAFIHKLNVQSNNGLLTFEILCKGL